MSYKVDRKFLNLILGTIAAASLLALTPRADATIIGINFVGTVFSIDETTGSGAAIGPSGFAGTNSMTRNSAGTIYTAEGGTGTNTLVTINPITGAGTAGASFATSNGVRGLAFSSSDVLFAVLDTGPSGSLGPDSLFTIDVTTGALTLIGATGLTALQGLAFSPGGTLYGWDIDIGLVTINTSTGAATDVNPAVGAGADIQALDFATGGTLFGAREALFTINPATGVSTLVGSGGYDDVRGIALIGADLPEPAAVALVALALVIIAFLGGIKARA